MRFRKLPVEVEAVQYDGSPNSASQVMAMNDSMMGILNTPQGLYIPTLEGVMKADKGDWIIKGVNGELYPCKPDIFAKTYEAV